MNFLRRFLQPLKSPESVFRDRLVEAMWHEWANPKSADHYREENGWNNDHPLWCGQLVAVAARKAGIDPHFAQAIIPSTYRLASMDYRDSFYGDREPFVKVAPEDIKPGHIVCVRTSRDLPYGDHVVVPVMVEGQYLICIEGNARGLDHTGHWSPKRSVVLRSRHIDDVRAAYEVPKSALK